MPNDNYLIPNWPAPANIKAYTTTRNGGYSQGPFNSFNFGYKGSDAIDNVAQNYAKMHTELELPREPVLLYQIHSNIVLPISTIEDVPQFTAADGTITALTNTVCAVVTADCIPILICDRQANIVAAIHAGWRGIAAGIIEAAITATNTNPQDLLIWLGPAIGPTKFEVGSEVREIFVSQDSAATSAFQPHNDRWLADIYLLAKQRLLAHNVTAIYGGEFCTYTQENLFFSHRRDNGVTGHMLSLIWIAAS